MIQNAFFIAGAVLFVLVICMLVGHEAAEWIKEWRRVRAERRDDRAAPLAMEASEAVHKVRYELNKLREFLGVYEYDNKLREWPEGDEKAGVLAELRRIEKRDWERNQELTETCIQFRNRIDKLEKARGRK